MPLPVISVDDIRLLVSQARNVEEVNHGGQKRVFGCTIDGRRYVVKFLLAASKDAPPEASRDEAAEVEARAKREVETMAACRAPTLVKLGPIGLTAVELRGQRLLYFSEERIDGRDLHRILQEDGPLPIEQCVRLGRDITAAVAELWLLAKVHRDIKPGNSRRRDSDGLFILLDMGLAFDLADESITRPGVIVGTPVYFSPEQMEFAKRRQLDFRSDLFSLGIVLYEGATRKHPFMTPSTNTYEVLANILHADPVAPTSQRAEIPAALEDIIMRLLAKRPHLRFRTCEQLETALAAIRRAGE